MTPRRQRADVLVPLAALGLCFTTTAPTATLEQVPTASLRHCAEIALAADRLACYDALAGRQPQPSQGVWVAPSSKDAFGLSAARRAPVEVERVGSISARVARLGLGPDGRPTVDLDNGQFWALDATDPLLVPGDPVTIRGASLNSYLLTTPQGRTHRVRRLR